MPVRAGRLLAIAVRTERNGPMKILDFASVATGGGVQGDLPANPDRGVTILAQEHWDEVNRALRVSLPWHTRRANLLVQGLSMSALLGRHIRVGNVKLAITAETKPCELMDTLHPGLRGVLKPDCRGGVHGRVLEGGRISIGDLVAVLPV